jgi:hypothetical protein
MARAEAGRGALGTLLAPEPPRRIPGHRVLSVALRTAHLATLGILLGGHAFDVESGRLVPYLLATIGSGAGLVALELASTCAWLRTVKGVAILAKLALLLMVLFFWEYRMGLLLVILVLASTVSHMPRRFRDRRIW